MLLVMCMVLNELRVVHESIRPLVEDVTDLPLLFTTAMRIRFLISEYFSRRWEAMGLGLAHAQKEYAALQVCSRSADLQSFVIWQHQRLKPHPFSS